MNIYVTDDCPVKSAKNLDTNSVVKMLKDSSQIISTVLLTNCDLPFELVNYSCLKDKKIKVACYYKNLRLPQPQRPTHPWVEWTELSHSNYAWMFRFYHALCEEYNLIFDKQHELNNLKRFFLTGSQIMEMGPQTSFVNCAGISELGIDYRDLTDAKKAYKLLLIDKWELDPNEETWYKLKELKQEIN